MPHSTTNYISDIKLPNGSVYEIHDKYAIHDPADLGISGALIFKGVLDSVGELPTAAKSINGHVYLIDKSEYVCVNKGTDAAPNWAWEELGDIHDAASSTHTHGVTVTGTNSSSTVSGSATVTGTNSTSSVSGSATVTGHNEASAVTGTATITNAPNVTPSPKYAKVTTGTDTFVKSYPGSTKKLVTTSIKPAAGPVSVVSSVDAPTGTITGVSGSVTASKATPGTAVTVATRASSQTTVGNANVGTAVTNIATKASTQTTVGNANVGTATTVATGLTGGSVSAGKAASWKAEVNNGVLEFSFTANTPTAVTLPTATTTSITPAKASTTKIWSVNETTESITPATTSTTKIYAVGGTTSVTPYTFADVTVPVASTEKTFVTSVSPETTDVATVGSAVTVATGALGSTGSGSVLVGLGTATTATALTSATLAAGTDTDVHTGDAVTVTNDKTLTGTISGTAAAQKWTQDTGTISGTAAAQTWTQKSGTISGTAAAQTWTQKSGSTSSPTSGT